MAIRLDKTHLAKKLTSEVVKTLRAEFVSDTKKRQSLIGPEFQRDLHQVAFDAAMVVAPALDYNLKQSYIDSLVEVADLLKSGLEKQPGWPELSPKYRDYKRRKFPGTENKFWLRSGETAKAFRKLVTNQKRILGITKNGPRHSKFSTVTLVSEKHTHNKRRYQFAYELQLPEITTSTFMDTLLRKQFILNTEDLSLADLQETDKVLARIRYNEISGKRIRPWIQEHMQAKGLKAEALISRRTLDLFRNR